ERRVDTLGADGGAGGPARGRRQLRVRLVRVAWNAVVAGLGVCLDARHLCAPCPGRRGSAALPPSGHRCRAGACHLRFPLPAAPRPPSAAHARAAIRHRAGGALLGALRPRSDRQPALLPGHRPGGAGAARDRRHRGRALAGSRPRGRGRCRDPPRRGDGPSPRPSGAWPGRRPRCGGLARDTRPPRAAAPGDVERDGLPRALPLGRPANRRVPGAARGRHRDVGGRRGAATAVVGRSRGLRLRPRLGLRSGGRTGERPPPALRVVRQVRDARHPHLLLGADGDRRGHGQGQRMTASARTLAAAVSLLVVLCLLAQHAAPRVNLPGHVDPARWVLQDFRDSVYYPVVAFLDGRNPYDQAAQARTYPVGQVFPPYLPLTLIAHLPFGLVSHALAAALYGTAVLALTAVLAALALGGAGVPVTAAATLGLTAALLLSRPGYMNLLLGQVTAQVAIGAYVALRWARKSPIIAGLGLAFATLKPTYGVPLAVLMLLGRGDVTAVAAGAALSAALCLGTLVPLAHAAGGVAPFVASLGGSTAAFSAEGTSNAWSSFARLDVVALAARVLGRVPDVWMQLLLAV